MANHTFVESSQQDLHGGHTFKLVYCSYRNKPGGDSFGVFNHISHIFGNA